MKQSGRSAGRKQQRTWQNVLSADGTKKDEGTDHGPESSSSSSGEEEDEDMAWRDGCALEEIAEPQEYKEQRKRCATREAKSTQKKNLETAAAAMKKSSVSGGNSSAPSSAGAACTSPKQPTPKQPTPSKEVPGTTAAGPLTASNELSDRDASRVKTSIPWVKRLTPGHPLSHVQVGDEVLLSRLHCNWRETEPGKNPEWFAKYELSEEVRATMPSKYKGQSKSKGFIRHDAGSEHKAFQLVLDWIWGKHATVSPGTIPPTWVTAALQKCPHCQKKLPCDAMVHNWASNQDSCPVPVRLQTSARATSAATPQGTAVDEFNTMETDHGSTKRPSGAALAKPRRGSGSGSGRRRRIVVVVVVVVVVAPHPCPGLQRPGPQRPRPCLGAKASINARCVCIGQHTPRRIAH